MSSEHGIFSTFAKGFLLHKLLLKVNYSPLRVKKSRSHDMGHCLDLGSVAGPVIQATGKSTFEDGLRSGGSGSDFKRSFNVRARLPIGYNDQCATSSSNQHKVHLTNIGAQLYGLWVRAWSVPQKCCSGKCLCLA
jgi:hypothetical protein